MRVIAGYLKGRRLEAPQGKTTRPTTDRIKETLFNIIQYDVSGSVFLDLFSGSGGIAIEAISRGAKEAVLVENDTRALACIRRNLEHTQTQGCIEIMASNALNVVGELERKGKVFDIIFMDPPYDRGMEKKVLDRLIDSQIVHEGSMIIVETSVSNQVDYMYDYDVKEIRIKTYKTNKHIFIIL